MKFIEYSIFIILFMLLNIAENWFRELEIRTVFTQKTNGLLWHIFQFINWALTLSFIAIKIFDFSVGAISILLLSAIFWWIFYDGTLDLLRRRKFFYASPDSSDPFQKYGIAKIQIPLFMLSIFLLIIIIKNGWFYLKII